MHPRRYWVRADLERDQSWRRPLDPTEIADLESALRAAQRRDSVLELACLTAAAFPLGDFAAEVERLRAELVDGCGVVASWRMRVSPLTAMRSTSCGRCGGA